MSNRLGRAVLDNGAAAVNSGGMTDGGDNKTTAAARYDVAISGGGLVGLTLGCTLAQAGLTVAVVDAGDPPTALAEPFDGRASAIARGSQQALAAVGLWDDMIEGAAPIRDIRVSDGRVGEAASRLFLHYDSAELGQGPLGFIVENRIIRRALHAQAARLRGLTLLAPARVAGMAQEVAGARVTLEDGRELDARLVVAAEGRRSPLRDAAGIRTVAWEYGQAGIVCTLVHELPHHDVAHEHFLPSGPFAVLPLTDGPAGEHRSSIVWTERRDLVPALLDLDADAFSAEIQRRFGDTLGRIRAEGRRWSYPLSLMYAVRTYDRRLVLVGDSAHGIHPIAGQGFNLGLRDVAALAECIVDTQRLGLDIGADDVLQRYEEWRRFDSMALIAVTDGLNRLFSNDWLPVRAARDLGLAAVNRAGPLKRVFMRHAMGLAGDLPRLVRGEPL